MGVRVIQAGSVPRDLLDGFPPVSGSFPVRSRLLDPSGALRADLLLADPLPATPLPADPLPADPPPADPLPADPPPADPLPAGLLRGDFLLRDLHHSTPTLIITAFPLSTRECHRVLGLSSRGRNAAVVSVSGLEAKETSRPAAPDLVRARLRNLALHELGHLAGFRHCRSPSCLMNPVTSGEDLDFRHDALCRQCRGDGRRTDHAGEARGFRTGKGRRLSGPVKRRLLGPVRRFLPKAWKRNSDKVRS